MRWRSRSKQEIAAEAAEEEKAAERGAHVASQALVFRPTTGASALVMAATCLSVILWDEVASPETRAAAASAKETVISGNAMSTASLLH